MHKEGHLKSKIISGGCCTNIAKLMSLKSKELQWSELRCFDNFWDRLNTMIIQCKQKFHFIILIGLIEDAPF